MEIITALVLAGTPFVLNGIMTAVKWIAKDSVSKGWKRGVLLLFSVIGAFATSYLTGNPVDMDSLTSLLSEALLTLVYFLSAHASYVLFWKKS